MALLSFSAECSQHGLPVRIICEDNLGEDLSPYRGLCVTFAPAEVLPAKDRAALEQWSRRLPAVAP